MSTDPNYTYIGYSFRAGGGFHMQQHLGQIPFIGSIGTDLTQLYDLTNTLQIDYDVRIFNEKLGIYKNATNEIILDSSNSLIRDDFTGDTIYLSANDFLNNISAAQITDMGKYSTIYTDFIRKTNTYFGYPDGFDRILDASGSADVSLNAFSKQDLLHILKQRHIDGSGNDAYKLSGTIDLRQLTNILSFMSLNDPFSNRAGKTQFDGFFAGDRILVETGITISMALTTYTADYITNPVSNNAIILQHVVNAPLLLTLQNLS